MSDKGAVYGIAISLLILNIVTPIFTYALTNIAPDQDFGDQVNYLDEEDLIESGIYLQAESRGLLTYGNYVQFNSSGEIFRVRWADFINHDFEVYTNVFLDIGGTWLLANLLEVRIDGDRYQTGLLPDYLTNNTIIEHWKVEYNWTRIEVPRIGAQVFITCEKYGNNITEALRQGELNVTTGNAINYENFTPLAFIGWYWGTLSGADYYNMPAYVSWIFRLQAILLIFSGIIIARDLIGLT